MSYHINGAHLSQDIEKYIISHQGKVQVNRTSKCALTKWKVVEKTVLSYRNIASFDCILELISQLEAKRLVPSNICSYFERRKQQALPVKRVC